MDAQPPAAEDLHLPISLAWAKGAYTVSVALGSRAREARLILDTGSSTLVVLPHAYAPGDDDALGSTSWAQQLRYGQGHWTGPVLRTHVALGEAPRACSLDDVQLALAATGAEDFHDADGIFGLAYGGLDTGHDMAGLLAARGVDPALTWPWPFAGAQDADADALAGLVMQQPPVALVPLFSQLAARGRVRDRFGLLVRRALVHVGEAGADDAALDADPLNRGVLVLGGGEACGELHDGAFQDIRIVHDLYYNASLVAVQVGDGPRIPVPPLDAAYADRAASNAILDTGSSFLVLEEGVHDAVMADLGRLDPRLPALGQRFRAQFGKDGQGVPNAEVEALDWPVLRFHLEADDGGEVTLACGPEAYWPRNAMFAGQAFFLLMPQLPGWPNQSILGLPLMAGRFCVFDRDADGGRGRVRVASARPPAADA